MLKSLNFSSFYFIFNTLNINQWIFCAEKWISYQIFAFKHIKMLRNSSTFLKGKQIIYVFRPWHHRNNNTLTITSCVCSCHYSLFLSFFLSSLHLYFPISERLSYFFIQYFVHLILCVFIEKCYHRCFVDYAISFGSVTFSTILTKTTIWTIDEFSVNLVGMVGVLESSFGPSFNFAGTQYHMYLLWIDICMKHSSLCRWGRASNPRAVFWYISQTSLEMVDKTWCI